MGTTTKIQWCDHTFNPWRGCTKVSPGCAHCYADTQAKRNPRTLGIWGPTGTRVVASEATWKEPLKWNRQAACCCRKTSADTEHESGCPQANRPRVFCASMADVFESWNGPVLDSQGRRLSSLTGNTFTPTDLKIGSDIVTLDDCRARLFRTIHETPNLDWLLLTKRPENVAKAMEDYANRLCTYTAEAFSKIWIRRVWLGVSVENQKCKSRIDLLRGIPAAVRFLSVEPLLEDIGTLDLTGIHWVIVGGESGGKARPSRVQWIRDIVSQCKAADVACFVKQLGSNPEGDDIPEPTRNPITGTTTLHVHQVLTIRDAKGGEPEEWPEDIRVREFPRSAG